MSAIATTIMEHAKPGRLLLTAEEARQSLHIGRRQLYELCRKGEIASVKIGKSLRIPVWALQEYVERAAGARRSA